MARARASKRRRKDIQSGLQPGPHEDAVKPNPQTPTGSTAPNDAPDSTHISSKPFGTEVHTMEVILQDDLYQRLGREMSGYWVGPMDPADFLKECLPEATGRSEFMKHAFEAVVNAGSEVKMYDPFVDAITPYAPQLKFVNTSLSKDMDYGKIAVNVSVYRGNTEDSSITATDFSKIEIPVAIKGTEGQDPFLDTKDEIPGPKQGTYPFERECFEGRMIRGQVAAYASALTVAQFRTHSFSVLICGTWARLLRWDRNGAVVTQRFLYAEKDHLVEFFWRYSQLAHDDPRRGHDATVVPLSSSHCRSKEEDESRRRMIDANQANHREFRVMLIPDRETKEESKFLVSYPPAFTRHSPVGRATRPMLAFDFTRKKLVFVKDYWRPSAPRFVKEGDIYKKLHAHKVKYIATFGKGNDIREHLTGTDTKRTESWALRSGKMVSLRHYRMSLEEVGRPLKAFKSSYELVAAIADAMEAHELARHEAKILHRDVSPGNILITESGRGMLIDWDLSIKLENDSAGRKARRPDRTGTWQFMSVTVLRDPAHRQDHIDDRESAFYVLSWNLMRYSLNNKLDELHEELKLFDECSAGINKGGKLKRDFLSNGVKEWEFNSRPLLTQLVKDLALTFAVRYESPLDPITQSLFDSEIGAKSPLNPEVRKKKLEDRWWLVDTIRKSLQDETQWPQNDVAKLNNIISTDDIVPLVRESQQLDITGRDSMVGSNKRKHLFDTSEESDDDSSDSMEEDEADEEEVLVEECYY